MFGLASAIVCTRADVSAHLSLWGTLSIEGRRGLVGRRSEAFWNPKKLAHCERAPLFSLFFPLPLFLKNTEWMHELLRASHHIPLPSPHVFHSCFWLVVVQKLKPPFFFFLCEHMINSWEHLTLSLHFFLTLVVSFSGEIDDTTQLSPVGVSLWGLLLRICTVTHVYKHADFFFF